MPPRMRQQAPSQLKSFVGRFSPQFQAGDTDGMDRMISGHPGLIGKLMNHGPGRRVEGVEKVQTPDGETRYAFRIRNARTGTTGPETANATPDPGDTVVSYSHEEIERAMQPFLPAAPDPTTEQRNVGAFLERNPGATEADYFAQKRSPGVSVFTGDLGGPEESHEADMAPHLWATVQEAMRYQIDPATGSHVFNDAEPMPKEILQARKPWRTRLTATV